MNNRTYFFILIVSAVSFLLGFKIGDSRGFEAGFQEGYSYDCQAEIMSLRATHEDLKKAVKTQEQITFQSSMA